MKKLLFFLTLTLSCSLAKADDMILQILQSDGQVVNIDLKDEPKNQLVVWAKDGTKVAYALAEKPKVTFTETDLIITAKGVEVSYSLENMLRFTYESNDESSIINLKNEESPFKLTGESLLFPALKANSTVSLYSLNGTLVFYKTVKAAGEYSFPLSGLNAGGYVVTVNSLTYKIVKR